MQLTLFWETGDIPFGILNWLQSPMHWLQSHNVLAMKVLFRHWWWWSVQPLRGTKSACSYFVFVSFSLFSVCKPRILWFLGVAALRSERQMRITGARCEWRCLQTLFQKKALWSSSWTLILLSTCLKIQRNVWSFVGHIAMEDNTLGGDVIQPQDSETKQDLVGLLIAKALLCSLP